MAKKTNKHNMLEKISFRITTWVGTPLSIIVHSIIFSLFTLLVVSGADFNKVMLIWNTSVSLEAIYLALFIQMTVNKNTQSLEEFGEDIEDIQEGVEDISEDIEDIQEDDAQDDKEEAKTKATLERIQGELQRMVKEVESLKFRS